MSQRRQRDVRDEQPDVEPEGAEEGELELDDARLGIAHGDGSGVHPAVDERLIAGQQRVPRLSRWRST